MKPQYERTSWGWLAYAVIDGHLRRGRGETKAAARRAMLENKP
jgi:hypothetical protein